MRTNMRKQYILGLVFVFLLATGCEDYLDINEDPNNPTSAPLSGLMVNSTLETGQNVYDVGGITSFYVQYLASPNEASSTDIHDEVSYSGTWANLYNIMTDLSDLEIQAEEEGATEYLGVAKILKAINLGMTVDLWGNVPYSEAFFAQTLTPGYDNAEALYTEIFTLLDDGIAALEQGNSSVELGSDDFFYSIEGENDSDIDAWISTANALRARYLLHLSETSAYDPQAVLAAVDNGYSSSTQDAQLNSYASSIQRNPWATVAINNDNLLLGGWTSEQLVEAMDGTTYDYVDPRMTYMFGTTDDGEYLGTPNGAGRGDAAEQGERSYLVTDSYYAAEQAPILVVTYFEQLFIEAEAALDAGDAGRAYDAYLAGIRTHMEKLGVEDAEIEGYLANPEVSVGATALTIDEVMKEKYIAMYLHPEAWVDARRYDYQYEDMTLPANHNPALGGEFIKRLVYPDTEQTRNSSNLPQVTLGDELFWDN